jgi:hypothetical protein
MARAAVCLVALGFAAMASAQSPARDTSVAPVGTATIRGRVRVAGADRGLSKVEIRAVASAINVTKTALTDADGRYEIRELPAGRYVVSASKTNYLRSSFGERRTLGAGQPIDVADGKTVDRMDFSLQRGGAVTGRIIDEFGDPLPDVQVMPMRFTFINGERRLQPFGMPSATDDRGEYRLFGLGPGQYVIAAIARPMGGPAETNDRSTYASTYYPGTASISEAQRLTVQATQTIASINMGLLTVTAGRIDGTVVDTQGRPMAGGFVNAMQRVGFMGFGSGGTQIKPDGSFSLTGIAPGDYTLRATIGGMSDDVAVANVTVGSGDTLSIQLASAKPMKLRGRVVVDDGSPLPSGAAVNLGAAPMTSIVGMGVGGSTTAKSDGTFEISGGAGRVRVNAFVNQSAPVSPQAPGWRLNRVLIGDADVTDAGFDAASGATVENIVVELTAHMPEIETSVVDGAGERVRDCVIVVFSSDSERWTAVQQRYVTFGRPNADGVYKARVPAGNYLVAAFDDPEPNLSIFADPELLAQLRERATPITVDDREQKKLGVTLVEPPVY